MTISKTTFPATEGSPARADATLGDGEGRTFQTPGPLLFTGGTLAGGPPAQREAMGRNRVAASGGSSSRTATRVLAIPTPFAPEQVLATVRPGRQARSHAPALPFQVDQACAVPRGAATGSCRVPAEPGPCATSGV